MNQRLVKRDLGLEIPGFTDEVLKRLKPPYHLIGEWAQYVPLDVLLALDLIAIGIFDDNDDGTVTMKWANLDLAGRDYVIPLNLFKRSAKHFEEVYRSNERHRRRGHGKTIFMDDGYDIDMARWNMTIEQALRSTSTA